MVTRRTKNVAPIVPWLGLTGDETRAQKILMAAFGKLTVIPEERVPKFVRDPRAVFENCPECAVRLRTWDRCGWCRWRMIL